MSKERVIYITSEAYKVNSKSTENEVHIELDKSNPMAYIKAAMRMRPDRVVLNLSVDDAIKIFFMKHDA